jgi:hypothetical protein
MLWWWYLLIQEVPATTEDKTTTMEEDDDNGGRRWQRSRNHTRTRLSLMSTVRVRSPGSRTGGASPGHEMDTSSLSEVEASLWKGSSHSSLEKPNSLLSPVSSIAGVSEEYRTVLPSSTVCIWIRFLCAKITFAVRFYFPCKYRLIQRNLLLWWRPIVHVSCSISILSHRSGEIVISKWVAKSVYQRGYN